MFGRRKVTPPKPCRTTAKYLFASSFFKNVRPGIEIGVNAGKQQVRNYMNGAWWNNDPVVTARNIHRNWGGIQK
ncbi:hypothetical protein QE82_15735 [Salmonella enterica subsp. enterica serovar Rubislaw]|nr:hypothetical protein [Salmonella enterica subsp. enterica serovar Rubislaw]